MRKSVEARKQQILQAALSIFEKNGFEAATVDEIVAKAGVSKGLAYHYFRSKDSILHEIIVRRLDELDELTGRMQAETSAAKRLRILVGQLVTELTEGERRQRFLITTFLHPRNNRLVQKAMRASPERFEKLHAEELRMLRDLAVAEPERELPLFRAGMQGMAMLYLLNPEVFPLRTVAESFMQKYGVLGGFDE